jgi:zinc transporter ZupT
MSAAPSSAPNTEARGVSAVSSVAGGRPVPAWLVWLIPLAALVLMLAYLAFGDPLSAFRSDLPPAEALSFERIDVTADGFRATVVNGGAAPVTVAQVIVDDAYWDFTIEPSAEIPRLGRATITIEYPWVYGEPHFLRLLTATGLAFEGEVAVAVETPTPGGAEFLAYGLVGIFVGIVPVALGMLFFPGMRRVGRRALNAVLALTIGMLVFLFIDTALEAFEVAAGLPDVVQGQALVLFAALLTWLVLLVVGALRRPGGEGSRLPRVLYVAGMIAVGIGLHNLGEGMAIGAAFSLGEAALGSFLVVGFTLHNITEGIGIVAPLTPGREGTPAGYRPRLWTFLALTMIAGAPAILGAWLGGFSYSPMVAAVFLGIGLGAIWQVIVEVGRLLRDDAARHDDTALTWANLAGFAAGVAVMYLTALLVKF